jgi:hypothetical protein
VVSEAEILLSGRSGWHKERRIPLSIKLGYTIFLAVWIPAYWQAYGWENFLWICDVANLLIGLALWLESPILIAAQAVGVLIIQALWLIDVLARLLIGFHPIGGTEYMFDATKPLFLRLLSLFHVCVPVLLLWAIARLGYDRRGWRLQAAFTALLLPTTFLLTDPADNINWIWRPFGIEQAVVPAPVFMLFIIWALPLLLYLPTHAALLTWCRRVGIRLRPTPRN